jgi:hypothetical protein
MRGRAEERVRSLPLRVRARRLSMASSPSKARAPCSSAAKVGSRPSCFSQRLRPRFLKARRRPHGVLVAAARAARAPLLDDLVDGDLARIRGSCTSFQKEPKHLFAFGSVITADLTSFVGLPARRRAMRILVSWYPVRPFAHIRLYTRSHLSVSVAPRAASPAGAPPGGAYRRPGLSGVYTIFDLSVTKG